MVAADLKHQIDLMTEDERFYVAAYLQHLANDTDEEYHAQVAEVDRRMDSGRKIVLEDLVARHEELEREGK